MFGEYCKNLVFKSVFQAGGWANLDDMGSCEHRRCCSIYKSYQKCGAGGCPNNCKDYRAIAKSERENRKVYLRFKH